jgi:hypothetical protein
MDDDDDDGVGRWVMPRNARLLAFSASSVESMSDDQSLPIANVVEILPAPMMPPPSLPLLQAEN